MTQRTDSEPKADTANARDTGNRTGTPPAREQRREKAAQATKTPTAEAFGSFEG